MLLTREEFVKKYSPFVTSITKGTGIFPQVMLAQAILESQGRVNGKYYPGQSKLARDYNNYFGIKASAGWKGKAVDLKTNEVYNGNTVTITDAFRVYNSVEDSMRDYLKFLQENPRYTKAGVFTASTPKEQAERLRAAGYATNPNYASLIDSIGNSIAKYIDIAKKNPIATIAVVIGLFFLIKND